MSRTKEAYLSEMERGEWVCVFCGGGHHPLDMDLCGQVSAEKPSHDCGGQVEVWGAMRSLPCMKCDEEYRAYQDAQENRERYIEALTKDERAA